MRTLFLLRRDLARANLDEVAALARVNVKTVKRVLAGHIGDRQYTPRLDVAERISSALDCVELAPAEESKPSAIRSKQKQEA